MTVNTFIVVHTRIGDTRRLRVAINVADISTIEAEDPTDVKHGCRVVLRSQVGVRALDVVETMDQVLNMAGDRIRFLSGGGKPMTKASD